MSELAKAIVNVMKAVKNIEKNMSVGTGGSSYKGVADKDVKYQIGQAMAENGLCIIPTGIESSLSVERWTEDTSYGPKQKQQVFNEVKTTYKLMHISGESIDVVGSGHGVDSMDKAAGKATTYALKYALLYLFMVPTGNIDDADKTHSDDHDAPKSVKKQATNDKPKAEPGKKYVLNMHDSEKLPAVLKWVADNKHLGLLAIVNKLSAKYELSSEVYKTIEDEVSAKK